MSGAGCKRKDKRSIRIPFATYSAATDRAEITAQPRATEELERMPSLEDRDSETRARSLYLMERSRRRKRRTYPDDPQELRF